MVGKQLKSACRQFLCSRWHRARDTRDIGLNPLSVQSGKEVLGFFFAVSSARAELHSAGSRVACSVVCAAPGVFPIPTFLPGPAQRFHSSPLCFLGGAEAAECRLPTGAGLIRLFRYLPRFLSSESISLPLRCVPCSRLQNRAVVFGRSGCLWNISVIFLCVNPLNSANWGGGGGCPLK